MQTDMTVTLADNGYIVQTEASLCVYESAPHTSGKPPRAMLDDILSDLLNTIDEGAATKFRVQVTVEPVTDN